MVWLYVESDSPATHTHLLSIKARVKFIYLNANLYSNARHADNETGLRSRIQRMSLLYGPNSPRVRTRVRSFGARRCRVRSPRSDKGLSHGRGRSTRLARCRSRTLCGRVRGVARPLGQRHEHTA